MMKQMITALTFSLCAASVFAAGSVKVITTGSTEAKTLTGAEHLLDLVGQPRLSNSWWLGAVISEERATTEAQRQQQALLARLAALSAEASGDDAGAINLHGPCEDLLHILVPHGRTGIDGACRRQV